MFKEYIFVAAILAMGQSADAEEAKKILDDAFKLTKSANSKPEYDSIIDRCHDAQKLELSRELSDYAKRLLAWTYNRRGETYSQFAKKQLDEGDAKGAGEYDKLALEDFEEAVLNDPTRWKALHNRGVSYALLGDYENAIKDFTFVVGEKPDYVNAWFNRAEIHFELRKFQDALRGYNEVIKLNEGDNAALRNRGRTYLKLGQAPEGLRDLEKAIRLDAEDATALVYRGEAHQMMGQWQKAAKDFRQAIDIDKNLGRAFMAAAWLWSTCPDDQFREPEKAIEAANKAIELDHVGSDGEYRYWDVLAAAFANANQFDEAMTTLDRVMKTVPPAELAQVKKRRSLYADKKPYRLEKNDEKRR